MFAFYIDYIMWILVLKLRGFKLLWIFLFVVLCITAFLMVMYNRDKEELKKSENESVGKKLQNLAANLSNNEHTIKSAENALSRIENMSPDVVRDRYKSLLSDLKKDLRKTETEVKILQSDVLNLSKRRENLKNDLLNQRTDYQNMLDAFGKEKDGTDRTISRIRGY